MTKVEPMTTQNTNPQAKPQGNPVPKPEPVSTQPADTQAPIDPKTGEPYSAADMEAAKKLFEETHPHPNKWESIDNPAPWIEKAKQAKAEGQPETAPAKK
jgi:hypothetical protein